MDKEQLLQELNERISTGEVTREEVARRLGITTSAADAPAEGLLAKKSSHHFSVTKMLYFIGAGIVLTGIFFFIAQIWDDLGAVSRISITFGLGVLVSLLGSVLYKQKPASNLGSIFHTIGGVLVIGGVMVLLEELEIVLFGQMWTYALAYLTVFIFYLLLLVTHRHVILTFFAIVNGTIATYLLSGALLDPLLDYREMETLFQYLTMALGGSYLFLAQRFQGGWNKRLVGVLRFFGITGLLGAAFSQVFDSTLWEMLYFLLIFGSLLLSVHIRSRSVLIMSTLFLLVHIAYITSEYFADSIGWPIALVILGLIFIGLGYASLTIHNTYITKTSSS